MAVPTIALCDKQKFERKVDVVKKFAWIFCFTLLLGLLAGCQTDPVNTLPTVNTAPAGTTAPQVTEPVDTRLLPPENPGNSLIEYDPDRQIYIDSENVYVDYYVGVSGFASFGFEIYSRQKLDPEEIKVTVPVDLPFQVMTGEYTVVERKPNVSVEAGNDGAFGCLPYYLYLAYRGETFEAGEAVAPYDLEGGIYEVMNTEGELVYAGDVLAGKYELKEGEEIDPRYREFASLKEEDLPEFYVYGVTIVLFNITDLQETVVLDKLDLTIGGETYEAKLGCVRLLPQEAFPADAKIVGGKSRGSGSGALYNDGIFIHGDAIFIEELPEDITITGLRMAEEASRILDITVALTSGGQYMEMKWDGASPLYLFKGDGIRINAVVKNEHAAKFMGRVWSHAIVEYTNSANEQLCSVATQAVRAVRSPYEYYAIIFDGLDLEPYYRNYFYKNFFQWVDEYRDK